MSAWLRFLAILCFVFYMLAVTVRLLSDTKEKKREADVMATQFAAETAMYAALSVMLAKRERP